MTTGRLLPSGHVCILTPHNAVQWLYRCLIKKIHYKHMVIRKNGGICNLLTKCRQLFLMCTLHTLFLHWFISHLNHMAFSPLKCKNEIFEWSVRIFVSSRSKIDYNKSWFLYSGWILCMHQLQQQHLLVPENHQRDPQHAVLRVLHWFPGVLWPQQWPLPGVWTSAYSHTAMLPVCLLILFLS